MIVMKWFLVALTVVISCGKPTKEKPSSGDNSTGDQVAEDSEEIKKLKAEIERLNNKQSLPVDLKPDDDGWIITAGDNDEKIRIGGTVWVRVDFADDDIRKQMHMKLSDCSGVKITGEEIASSTGLSTTINSKVGKITEVSFYRQTGEVTAPAGACKLTATIINRADGSRGKSKSKTFSIEAGTVKLSQLENTDYFAINTDGKLTISLKTKGIDAGSSVMIVVFDSRRKGNSDDFVGIAPITNFPSNGEIRNVRICGNAVGPNDDGDLICGDNDDRWLTGIAADDYLIHVVGYSDEIGVKKSNKSGVLEISEQPRIGNP